jgi:hypothetical protein
MLQPDAWDRVLACLQAVAISTGLLTGLFGLLWWHNGDFVPTCEQLRAGGTYTVGLDLYRVVGVPGAVVDVTSGVWFALGIVWGLFPFLVGFGYVSTR